MCGLQNHDFGIVSMGHSLGNAASARQMTKSALVIKPQGTWSLQPAGQPEGSLRHKL